MRNQKNERNGLFENASLAKSAETSRQLFSFLMFPLLFFLAINLFSGVPEVMSTAWNSNSPLLYYLVP